MEHILRYLGLRRELLNEWARRRSTNGDGVAFGSKDRLRDLYGRAAVGSKPVDLASPEGFCRAYFDEEAVEQEILPIAIGLDDDPNKLYSILAGLPESLTFANLRLRARALAYVQDLSDDHLNKLAEELADFVTRKSTERIPYEAVVVASFSMANNELLRPIVERLTKILRSGRAFDSLFAASALGEVGGDQAERVLLTALSEGDTGTRMQSAFALGKIGSESAVPQLCIALRDEAATVRWAAASALEEIKDTRAVPYLLDCVRDGEDIVRFGAASALGKIGGEEVITRLERAMEDEDGGVRMAASLAVGLLGDGRAVAEVIRVLRDDSAGAALQERAASVLGEIDGAGAEEALVEAMMANSGQVRRAAAAALGELGAKGGREEAVIALVGALGCDDDDIRWRAAWELGKIKSRATVPALAAALQATTYSGSRWRAAEALGKIGGTEAEEALRRALTDEDSKIRTSVALSLGRLGHVEVVGECLEALKDGEALVRWRAAEALGQIGGEEAVPPLLRALKDVLEVQGPAAAALARMDVRALGEGLRRALADPQHFVRQVAARAIGYYTFDEQAHAELRNLELTDPIDEVRKAASEGREKFERKLDLCESHR
jgi:HEAT repeat protein